MEDSKKRPVIKGVSKVRGVATFCALAAKDQGLQPVVFTQDRVDVLVGETEKTSAICLKNGMRATVSLPLEELHTVLYGAKDGAAGLTDLRLYQQKIESMSPAARADKKEDREPDFAPAYRLGEVVKGKGIYCGVWKPRTREGMSLGKAFNLFAAPQDLRVKIEGKKREKKTFTYPEAVTAVAALKGWNGHDGGQYEDEVDLYDAIHSEKYNGGWFIPTRDIIDGRNCFDEAQHMHNFKALRNVRGLVRTWQRETLFRNAEYYWSCTPCNESLSYVFRGYIAAGGDCEGEFKTKKSSVRPVRAELIG